MGAICKDPNDTNKIIYHQGSIGAAWVVFVFEFLIVAAIVILLINRFFALKKQTLGYYIGIFIGWLMAVYSIVLMPVDITMVNTYISVILLYILILNCRRGMISAFVKILIQL